MRCDGTTSSPSTSQRRLPVTKAGWEHGSFAVCVWRSVRVRGDTKTGKSRRTLALPQLAVAALAALWRLAEDERRAPAGKWIDTGLVFTTAHGTVMDPGNLGGCSGASARRPGSARTGLPGN